jgi:hypothetical protein
MYNRKLSKEMQVARQGGGVFLFGGVLGQKKLTQRAKSTLARNLNKLWM